MADTRPHPRRLSRIVISTLRHLAGVLLVSMLLSCSPKQMAVDLVADAVTGGEASVFASDPDPDLVREALPFGLKTYESLLQSTPEHRGLLLATAKGFTAYAYMLKEEADRTEALEPAHELRLRAKGLFLRGRDYALKGLEVAHPGFAAGYLAREDGILEATTLADADFLYWAGAAWAGAISSDKQDFMLLAELDLAAGLVERVLELDETYDKGAAHQFMVSYEGSRPAGDIEAARAHYRRALELSGGSNAGLYLALAEAVAVPEQDLREFRRLVAAALAVELDTYPDQRLANALAQRRARWLLTRIPDLFLEAPEDASPPISEGIS
ncbi:MAG: TRAP transporter TatT component family protein [Rhodovibrionaceae bacterium]|nr:TRAP transporter TatT component family protein [Rhodovibrionaceae bacterium]